MLTRRWACVIGLAMMAFAVHAAAPRVMVFSKTDGYRHASIPNALAAIREIAAANHLELLETENGADFNDASLATFSAVMFVLTIGDVLDAAQQAAFERYIRAGGGFVGIHSAADTEHSWPWYGGLVGTWYRDLPAMQKASVIIEDRTDVSTRFMPETWVRTDELYNFESNPRANVRVLCRLDERSYSGGTMGDHPISWSHEYDGGRAWFTGLGHAPEAYDEPLFRSHIEGGILYAARLDAKPPPGALVLFDGTDASHWVSEANVPGLPWQTTNGMLTTITNSGSIRTVQSFEDYLLHLEFRLPSSPAGTAEGALNNSGVFLQNQFEIQITESYGRPLGGANDSGAIYGRSDATINCSLPGGTWETYDIDFTAAKWSSGTKTANARVTVWWNGERVQNDVPITSPTAFGSPPETPPPGPITLEWLVGLVQFRNVWILPRASVPRGNVWELVRSGTTWRYLDDGSPPPANWTAGSFNDSGWLAGRAQLGYGDGDEATVIRSTRVDNSRIITTYFRKPFTATNLWSITNLVLRVLRDDGAIVYLNGMEIFRNNMPVAGVSSTTPALAAISGVEEQRWLSTNVPAALLIEGTNVLAAEIHQSGASSSDVSFDLELSALQFERPEITIVRTNAAPVLTWPALPAGFQLECASSITDVVWKTVSNVSVIPDVRGTAVATNGASNTFYRLRRP